MTRIVNIDKARTKKRQPVAGDAQRRDGFQPCSPDMTICGDCMDNRARNKCPRLREWLARLQER